MRPEIRQSPNAYSVNLLSETHALTSEEYRSIGRAISTVPSRKNPETLELIGSRLRLQMIIPIAKQSTIGPKALASLLFLEAQIQSNGPNTIIRICRTV
jgi:hypothetical protein